MSIDPQPIPKEIPSPGQQPEITPPLKPYTPVRPGKDPEIQPTPEPYIPDQPDEVPSEDDQGH